MVEFEVNEQCVQYNECSTYSAFISAGKPVFHIEYLNDTTTGIQNFCDAAGEEGFSTVIKNIGLDEFYETC
jgi:endo-alpha-1,4-polygalactosaminidase (GH114 family)